MDLLLHRGVAAVPMLHVDSNLRHRKSTKKGLAAGLVCRFMNSKQCKKATAQLSLRNLIVSNQQLQGKGTPKGREHHRIR